jgi:hypothetical protein
MHCRLAEWLEPLLQLAGGDSRWQPTHEQPDCTQLLLLGTHYRHFIIDGNHTTAAGIHDLMEKLYCLGLDSTETDRCHHHNSLAVASDELH